MAAILTNPEDAEGSANAMLSLAAKPVQRSRLSLIGGEQAKKFDCKRSTRDLLQLRGSSSLS